MKYLDITFDAPEKNMACDEALLELCEQGQLHDEALRFWAPQNYFVVVGYSNKVAQEVRLEACQKQKIPVLRRVSGGGTVLQGPGCLNYTLVLRIPESGPLAHIAGTHCAVLTRHKEALEPLIRKKITVLGDSDLAIENLKFSGNAQRRKRRYVLYHGTFLLHMNLEAVETFLRHPSREPAYRAKRNHRAFLTNLFRNTEQIKSCLRAAWAAHDALEVDILPHIARIAATARYESQVA